jgi:hypothetical protein
VRLNLDSELDIESNPEAGLVGASDQEPLHLRFYHCNKI